MNSAVSAAATVDASTPQIAANATPANTTLVRQAVKVETLLQNALSVGESVRPDGQGQMEMRVRLGGGAEDVTVRMQVTSDRLQVTFQTASPELRSALESGWQQFSATASQTSTLSLAPPRFETGGFDPTTTGPQTDAQNFSSGQQDPRRQDSATASADDGLPSTASRRAGPAPVVGGATALQQSSGRRWNSWA